jgi:YidC/Oxa1 family membrane protein insertase
MNNEMKNLSIAIILSIIIMGGWQIFYEMPNQEKIKLQKKEYAAKVASQNIESAKNHHASLPQSKDGTTTSAIEEKQVTIANNVISGSISSRGVKFNSINLLNYQKSLTDNNPVDLLNNKNYFASFGFTGEGEDDFFPSKDTVWNTDGEILSEDSPVKFSWENKFGVIFEINISLDSNYMFCIEQTVINNNENNIKIRSFGLLNRNLSTPSSMSVAHEGAVAVFNGTLKETSYKDLEGQKTTKTNIQDGWLGFADKYWVTAIVPSNNHNFSSNSIGYSKNQEQRYQVDFLSEEMSIAPHEKSSRTNLFYAGPKDIELLDSYEKSDKIALFDRAVDFGWFYFLTKPMYLLLKFLNGFLHNWGLSILALTLVIKLLMFPVANKGFIAMNKMKKLQPEIDRIKELCGSDKIRLQHEIMALYKKNNVSTLSGCLPVFLQIPVFFSLYKVIYISIGLRQAPFYGWIKIGRAHV